MLYIRLEKGRPVETTDKHPGCGDHWADLRKLKVSEVTGWITSRDFTDLAEAQTIATYLTAMKGKTFLAADEGGAIWPRYRVIEAPCVGDEVSKSFNGDSYPCGKIVKITPTWQITTDQGVKFRRYQNTAGWRQVGGTWWMIGGVHNDRNPHF